MSSPVIDTTGTPTGERTLPEELFSPSFHGGQQFRCLGTEHAVLSGHVIRLLDTISLGAAQVLEFLFRLTLELERTGCPTKLISRALDRARELAWVPVHNIKPLLSWSAGDKQQWVERFDRREMRWRSLDAKAFGKAR